MKFTQPLFKDNRAVRNGYWLIGERSGKFYKMFDYSKSDLLSIAADSQLRPLYFIRVKMKRDEARLAA